MAELSFTPNLLRHVDTPGGEFAGGTVREVFEAYFAANPRVRSYVLDDQGALRKHVLVFLRGELIRDRMNQSDAVGDTDPIFVTQALSGG